MELGIPELTDDQIEAVSREAENAARKHVLSKVPTKNLERLNVIVEAEGTKPLNLTIEVNLELATQTKGVDAKGVANEAAKQALTAAENYLRNLK